METILDTILRLSYEGYKITFKSDCPGFLEIFVADGPKSTLVVCDLVQFANEKESLINRALDCVEKFVKEEK